MFLWIMVFILIGMLLGIVTGLVPGLHPNTVFVIMVSMLPLLSGFPVQCIIVFVTSLAITNTFTDFLPSLIFGAPEPDTAISVLPAHKMLLSGSGYEAIMLTVIGGLLVSLLTLLLLPFLLYVLPIVYTNMHSYIHVMLILVTVWIIMTENGKARLYALGIFLLTGIFGFISLNALSDFVLFPSLSGLFGLSSMATSLMARTTIPKQQITDEANCNYVKGTLASWLSGSLVGLLPGVGSAQASIISSHVFRNKTKEFLMTLGGINTANMFFTLIVFYSLGKTRSGTAWAVSHITETPGFGDMLLIVFTCVFTACASVIITLRIGRFILMRMESISYAKTTAAIIAFVVFTVAAFTGWVGLIVLFTGFFMGLLDITLGLNRTHLMGFLVFPTIIYFSGMNVYLLEMLGL